MCCVSRGPAVDEDRAVACLRPVANQEDVAELRLNHVQIEHLRWPEMVSSSDTDSHTDPPSEHSAAPQDELQRSLVAAVPDADGPVSVLEASSPTSDDNGYEVSVSRLVALGSDDAALADVYVPVPWTGHVSLASDGTAESAPPVDDDTTREVQAWARNLLASGAVRGVVASAPSYGPPNRPTHEIVEDENGRRVLRRIGFAAY
jgi:hypothetical protein